MKNYYLDSCIWLNLFKKEKHYWKIAENFIKMILFSTDEITYSGFILKELKFKLNKNKFNEKVDFLKQEKKFNFIKSTQEDYNLARKIESEFNFEISFFDCLHISICKRLNFILITRDKLLIEKAKKYVIIKRPEELLA